MNWFPARPFLALVALLGLAVPALGEETVPPERIAQLVESLGAGDWSEREAATAELKRIGAQAVPALEKAARDHEDLEVRHRAHQILGGFVYTNREFLMSFALLGDEALPRLAEIVGKADAVESALAAEVLGELGSPGALKLLERLATHESPVVQARTASALGLFSCERSLSLLR
ncbi:MAG: HEAT repeat domain-containing protein, partial [Planctomycetes bacterium]|nr:HEAT repeat domain-containing protein [Planctomycetota bacterium]